MLTILSFWIDLGGQGVLKYLSVYLLSTFHFFSGLSTGLATGLPPVEIAICGLLGIMTTLSVFLFGGRQVVLWIQSRLPARWQMNDENPRWQRAQHMGVWGVTCTIPILVNPIMGGFLHLAFKSPRWRTWWISWLFCGFWVSVITYSVAFSVDWLSALFG